MPYFSIGPSIGQAHENSCWAASLAWFLKAVQGGRPDWNQTRIISLFDRYTDDNGAMRPEAMVGGWNSDTRLKMSTRVWPTPDATLNDLPLRNMPVCIAFKHMTGFAHMNVIWRNGNDGIVKCMEPFWPFPGVDGKRTGRMVERSFEHFNFGDNVVLAWARPFDGSSTSTPAEAG